MRESVTEGHVERSLLIYLRMLIDVPSGSGAQIWPQASRVQQESWDQTKFHISFLNLIENSFIIRLTKKYCQDQYNCCN